MGIRRSLADAARFRNSVLSVNRLVFRAVFRLRTLLSVLSTHQPSACKPTLRRMRQQERLLHKRERDVPFPLTKLRNAWKYQRRSATARCCCSSPSNSEISAFRTRTLPPAARKSLGTSPKLRRTGTVLPGYQQVQTLLALFRSHPVRLQLFSSLNLRKS